MNGDENAFNRAQRKYEAALAVVASETVVESVKAIERGFELHTSHGEHQVKSQSLGLIGSGINADTLKRLLSQQIEIHAKRQGITYQAMLASI